MLWYLIFCTASTSFGPDDLRHWSSVCVTPQAFANKEGCDAVGLGMLSIGGHSEYENYKCIKVRNKHE